MPNEEEIQQTKYSMGFLSVMIRMLTIFLLYATLISSIKIKYIKYSLLSIDLSPLSKKK